MRLAVLIGFPLTLIGLVLYFPPLVEWLTLKCGTLGRFSGPVVFAVGWSLTVGYLAYNLGIKTQQSSED